MASTTASGPPWVGVLRLPSATTFVAFEHDAVDLGAAEIDADPGHNFPLGWR